VSVDITFNRAKSSWRAEGAPDFARLRHGAPKARRISLGYVMAPLQARRTSIGKLVGR
jgi:hypothetical protein